MDRIATGGAAANGQALTFSFAEAASASVSAAAYAVVTDVLALVGCSQAMPRFLARPPPFLCCLGAPNFCAGGREGKIFDPPSPLFMKCCFRAVWKWWLSQGKRLALVLEQCRLHGAPHVDGGRPCRSLFAVSGADVLPRPELTQMQD